MIRRISEALLLRPEDVQPLRDDFQVVGVFNPGVVENNNEIVLLARVAEKPLECRPGFVGLPRFGLDGDLVIDWVPEVQLEQLDPRVVRNKVSHLIRLTSISHLRVFRCHEGRALDWVPGSALSPESSFEELGIEDPRITQINGRYWITYVAVSRRGITTALASTNDFVTFDRHGIIYCPENKDVVLFPKKVQNQYVSLHRPTGSTRVSRPEIWLARSPDLLHWGQHECLFGGNAEWETDRVGAGTPPILIEEGWLEIYHGARQASRTGEVGAYSAGAVLLDCDNPARVLRRTHEPIMKPTADFERAGFVGDVVFPTALVERGDTLRVFYGASDTFVGVVEFSREELLAALA